MRKPIIVGNWKMNKTIAEAKEFIAAVDGNVHDGADFGIATSFIALPEAIKASKNLIVAAQNCHFEDNGAFTGEVSVPMLQEVGTKWCIIGHSERREMFGDTNETVNKKCQKLLHSDMYPIVCVGESLADYEAGKTEEVIRQQVRESVANLCPNCVANKVVIAYEPIWAIGTGKSADKNIANECCGIVRDEIRQMYGDEAADNVRIQYGGSVKPENIEEYMAMENIDGALIGGASLKADSFNEIIAKVK